MYVSDLNGLFKILDPNWFTNQELNHKHIGFSPYKFIHDKDT